MATIDSYVVHSRVNAVSPSARRRLFLFAIAGCASVSVVAGLAFSGYAGTPWRAKFDARIAADSTPYPLNQDEDEEEEAIKLVFSSFPFSFSFSFSSFSVIN